MVVEPPLRVESREELVWLLSQACETVGHLYRGIEQGLERLVERHGEGGVFIGPPRRRRPPRCSSGRS